MSQHTRFRLLPVSLLASLLIGVSCNILSPAPDSSPSPPPVTLDTNTPSATEPLDDPLPTDTQAVEEPTSSTLEAQYGNLSMALDPALASEIQGETIPADSVDGDLPYWEILPEHLKITLQDYALSNTFHQPSLYVYPVSDLEAMNEGAVQIIADLQAVLEAQPQDFEQGIPFLPLFNAAQIIHAQVDYLTFQNGSGIRFLTLYGQAARVVSNHELFYTFQGLTSDGAYYIAAVLPVSHPSLPAEGDIPQDQYDSFIENYETYLETTVAELNAQAPESFVPSLELLDSMIQSLQVH